MKQNLIRNLLRRLNSEICEFGFRLKESKWWFTREEHGRREKFFIVFVKVSRGYRVRPGAGVRFDKVEDLFHITSGFEERYQLDTDTVGIDFWRVFGEEGFDLLMESESDIERLTVRLRSIFLEECMEYVSQFSTISDVDAAINSDPRSECPHKILPNLRCCTGLIAAKLASRSNYDEIEEIYRDDLRQFANGFYLPQFDSLSELLSPQ